MSPLVDGGQVIVHVGGNKSGALMALDGGDGHDQVAMEGRRPGLRLAGHRLVREQPSGRHPVAHPCRRRLGRQRRPPLERSLHHRVRSEHRHADRLGDLVLYSGIEQPLTALRIRESAGKWTAEQAWRADSVPMCMSTAVLSGGTCSA